MNKQYFLLYNKVFLLLFTVVFLGIHSTSFAQNTTQKTIVQSNTNRNVLIEKAKEFRQKQQLSKQQAIALATQKKWIIKSDSSQENTLTLQGLSTTGHPIYYTTFNLDAAKTISTDKVWPGSGLNLNLDGQGMLIGEWDGGPIAINHPELDGRAVYKNSGVLIDEHANHVAGTLVGNGVDSDAKGMAPEATLEAYDWDFDESEMAVAAANGLLISNHSYGLALGWHDGDWMGDSTISQTEDYRFGFYDNQAKNWDDIAYNAPYYLIVKAAGNDRSDKGPNGENPDGGINGFDCIGGAGVSKNILTVGAVDDITSGFQQPGDVIMSSFSSWGPTDDGRIKPDLVANGVVVYSLGDRNWNYAYKSGTSMASPSVAGSLLLVQQHYSNTHNGEFLKAATLKGLAIHTADEAGIADGPDYTFGWGLMNTLNAVKAINDEAVTSMIAEEHLVNNTSYTFTVASDGNQPLDFTISWTDPAGNPVAPTLNPTDLMLINDLDIRVSNDTEIFYPYILDPANPSATATNGDNFRDNVEHIHIQNPTAGNYTITVTHKGNLPTGSQDFSLIVTGRRQCYSYAENTGNSMINSFRLGDIQSISGSCATYTNFDYLSTKVYPNTTMDVEIGLGTCGSERSRIVKVFADWNADTSFDEITELVATSSAISTSGIVQATIQVPANIATNHQVQLLVVCTETNDPNEVQACGVYEYGETEKYTLQLVPSLPTIASFSPNAGDWGTVVQLEGNHLNEVQTILLDGISTSFELINAQKISLSIPLYATSGPITLINYYQDTILSITDFNVLPPQPPIIDYFSPQIGVIGDSLFIYGQNLLSTQAIRINGTTTLVIPVNDTLSKAFIPNTTSGPIHLINLAGETTSSSDLEIVPTYEFDRGAISLCDAIHRKLANQDLSSYTSKTEVLRPTTPNSRLKYEILSLRLRGSLSSERSRLSIYNGPDAEGKLLWTGYGDDATLTTVYSAHPTGALTIVHELENSYGSTIPSRWEARVSCYLPEPIRIDSLSNYTGYPGEIITIYGHDFFGIETVKFNGTNASFEHLEKDIILATVPLQVTTGPITVHSTIDGQVTSAEDFEIKEGSIMVSNDTLEVQFCDFDYYDPGGVSTYPYNRVYQQVILPPSQDITMSIEIDSLDLGSSDVLLISDDISSIRVVESMLPFSYTSRHPLGLLKITFDGKNSQDNHQGFQGRVSCVPISTPTNVNISYNTNSAYTPLDVRIIGEHLTGVQQITVGGTVVPFTISDGELWATIEGALTGEVIVTNAAGSGKSARDFQLLGIKMTDKPITVCGTKYYDSSGPSGSYYNNENIVQTVYPENYGDALRIIIENYDIERTDKLIIHNGIDTKAPILKIISGDSQDDTTIAANTEGALTFHFISDGYGNDYGWKANLDCVTPVSSPQFISFEPSVAYIGQEVTIRGSNFLGLKTVKVNGINQNINEITDDLIKITISDAATTTGKIELENYLGSTTSTTNLEIREEAILDNGTLYVCNSVYLDPGGHNPYPSPENGLSGVVHIQTLYPSEPESQLSITFHHYDAGPYDRLYVYDGTSVDSPILGKLSSIADTATFIATNPAGALTVSFGNTENSDGHSGWEASLTCITRLAPIITSFTPDQAYKNSLIEIIGSHFFEVTEVNFNGEAADFEVIDFEKIKAYVPVNATTGPITVINDYGEGSSDHFIVLDTLSNGPFRYCDYILVPPSYIDGSSPYRFTQDLYPSEPGKYVHLDFNQINLSSNHSIKVFDGFVQVAEFTRDHLPDGTEELYATNTEGNLRIEAYIKHPQSFIAHVTCIDPFPPKIKSVTVQRAMRNMEVTLEGSNFIDIEQVEIDGISVPYWEFSSRKLIITIPVSAQDGIITVKSAFGSSQYDYELEEGVVMSDDVLYVCDTITYYDDRGLQDHSDKDLVQTIYPGTYGQKVAIDFSAFNINGTFTIYDGTTVTNETKLTGIIYSQLPRIVASNKTGALTIAFNPHSSSESGWVAEVYCYQDIPPSIHYILPDSGYIDQTILIKGEDFVGTTQVLVNDLEANFEVLSFDRLNVTIPFGASTGPITVRNSAGEAISDTFRVLPGIRMSTSDFTICDEDYLDPEGGGNYKNNTQLIQTIYPATAGTAVRLDFDYIDLVDEDKLYIYDGTNTSARLIGEYQRFVKHSIIGNNPSGALTLKFVTNDVGTARGWAAQLSCYTIQAPVITDFHEKEGYIGEKVTIEGYDFLSVLSVKFNGIESTSFEVVNNEQIVAIVPTTSTGPITVTTSRGETNTLIDFEVLDGAVLGNNAPLYLCNQRLYDLGGPENNSDYSARQIIYPATAGSYVQFILREFIGNRLVIYDGIDHTAKVLPLTDTVTATNPQGALYLSIIPNAFQSWDLEADILCYKGGTPQITDFTPKEGYRGTEVMISGNKIANVTSVQVSGIEANFEIIGTTHIRLFVPGEATTGLITLTNQEGSTHSDEDFKVIGDGSIMSATTHYLCDQYYYDPAGPDSTTTLNRNIEQMLYPLHPDSKLLLEFEELDLVGHTIQLEHEYTTGGNATSFIYKESGIPSHPFMGSSIQLEVYKNASNDERQVDFKAKVRCIYPADIPMVYDFSVQEGQGRLLELSHFKLRNHIFSISELTEITIKSLPTYGTLFYQGRRAAIGTTMNANYGGDYLTFLPESEWYGTTSFEYTATNKNGESVNGVITLNITFVNKEATVQAIPPTSICAYSSQIFDLDTYIDDPNGPSEDFSYAALVTVTGTSAGLNANDFQYSYDTITHQIIVSSTSPVDGTYECELKIKDGEYDIYTSFSMMVKGQTNATISKNGTTLTASSGNSYKWYRNGGLLTNKTTKTIEANILGSYKVKISQSNGCTDTSEPVLIDIATAIKQEDISQSIKIYPNPAQESTNIEIENHLRGEFTIQVSDILGKTQSQTIILKDRDKLSVTLILEKLPKGVYFVKIDHKEYTGIKRLVKK